jgi:hypothetical protein
LDVGLVADFVLSRYLAQIKDALDGDDEEQRKKEELLRLKAEKEKAEARERIKEERGFAGKVYPTLAQKTNRS